MQNFGYFKHLIRTSGVVFLVSLMAACGPDDYGETQSGTEKTINANTRTEEGVLRTVPFITLRNKTGSSDATEYFGDERSTARAGYCSLSRTPLEALEPIAEKAPFYVPDDMVRLFGAGNFDIAAHSLGTRAVFLALLRMANGEQGSRPLVNQLVLLAPDIDVGIFKQQLPRIRPLVRNITIYVSSNDTPLALSRQVHGYPRLGESGPHLDGLTGVDIIDVSEIPVRYPSGHLYHLYNDIVTSDLVQLLDGGKPASQRSNLKPTRENYWLLQPQAVNRVSG